jgi:hypothetical protein
MALSATFTANFASFYDAVAKADKVLVDFGDGADKVGRRLDTLSNQFSGKKIVQEAALMVKAVEDIGGTSMLTEKELARLGATTNEAVEKMKALGMDVPANLQKIANETKNANKQTSDWVGSLTKIAGAVGIAFSVGAVKEFIGSIFDAAGAIKDMSDQWGISTTAVQQFTSAAKLSGVEAETVGKSINFLTEQLGAGTAEYKAQLANVGLSYDTLRKMPLEDAYKAVITAIGGIKDETAQLDIAEALLGDRAKKMVGAIRDGFLEASAAQQVMSEETIARLEAAGDAWDHFKNLVVIYSGEMLSAVMKTTGSMTKTWGTFFSGIGHAFETAFGGGSGLALFAQTVTMMDDLGISEEKVATVTGVMTDSTNELIPKLRTTAQVVADLKAKEDALKASQKARADRLKSDEKVHDDYVKGLMDEAKAVADVAYALGGNGLIDKATQYLEALKVSIPLESMTRDKQDEINKVMADAIGVYLAAGDKIPDAMLDVWTATNHVRVEVEAFRDNLNELNAAWLNSVMGKPGQIDLSKIGTSVTLVKPGMFDGMAAGLAAALSGSILRAIEGGGDLLKAAGSSIGSYLLDPKQSAIGKSIETAAKKLPGVLGGAISAAIPVVGALIGPAVSWLGDKIAGLFGKKEYEKLRDSFIAAAGGIIPLTIAARDAGTSLDELLAARGTDNVTNAIGKLQDAFKFQADALDVAISTAQKYGFTIEELGPAMARQELDKQAQALFKDWEVLNSAGIDTIAITERMSASISEYVQHALKMGTEVPDAMRPMLEAMAKSGNLLDENGNAITDLEASGIKFSLSMSEGFKALIEQVSKLTDAISRSLGLAIRNVPPVVVKGTVEWDVSTPPAPGTPTPGGSTDVPQYAQGTGGFVNFGAGTPVVLHGWEAVVPKADAGSFATVAGASMAPAAAMPAMPAIIINAQGAFFDTPASLQRLADRVSDALTAKYSLMGKLRAAV